MLLISARWGQAMASNDSWLVFDVFYLTKLDPTQALDNEGRVENATTHNGFAFAANRGQAEDP